MANSPSVHYGAILKDVDLVLAVVCDEKDAAG